ncbi:MAG: hypothetical protein CL909_01275 [Deltaproteobacteria bacterium]|jgi:hypothetical protein|uniref:DUF3015 domain-containing protein n=1 Tax=marine metagenome TaxID=408172 RepID=A0A381Q6Q3_9ZZZZ|nr:hypothetical protein [Deltaproteobacteria bacterium]MDP6308798.1 DUF3015 family protein [SAR324 cluster bacterium]MAF54715.1 hypothetical protein [Deltaproteobacteria bacterium]MDP6432603.1 DUF3015 family protein [SAR324 cluster bacterium]MDP7170490.1 DUF3015 family protein [SAR324 cluster bacterium]|tara:strand:+ start:628 stop:1242 length:615 start_codon:yes stop_codon:yes gene_type:complete
MVELNIGPAFPDFVESASEDQVTHFLHKFMRKIPTLLLEFFAVFLLLSAVSQSVQARHKCPKVPSAPGLMGITSSTTFIPSGSTMAAARSSETSGCDQGHPSENFYKPKNKRVALFLKENFLQIKLESAQGQGQHLDALAYLAGCTTSDDAFAELIRNNYVQVFDTDLLNLHPESSIKGAAQTSERLLNLMSNSPLLASSCESG